MNINLYNILGPGGSCSVVSRINASFSFTVSSHLGIVVAHMLHTLKISQTSLDPNHLELSSPSE